MFFNCFNSAGKHPSFLSSHINSSIPRTVQEPWGSSVFKYMMASHLRIKHLLNGRQTKIPGCYQPAPSLPQHGLSSPVLFPVLLPRGPGAQTSERSTGDSPGQDLQTTVKIRAVGIFAHLLLLYTYSRGKKTTWPSLFFLGKGKRGGMYLFWYSPLQRYIQIDNESIS